MNKPTKKEITDWCNALRSGEYKQTKYTLQKDIIVLNDELGFSFDEIADLLEAVYIHEVLK